MHGDTSAIIASTRQTGGGRNQRKSPPPSGPTNKIGFPVETGAGKRRAVAVEQMSVSVEDGDGLDEYKDINQTQYAGGKGSDEFDGL